MVNKQFGVAEAAALGRQLIRTALDAALGTLGEDGAPHVSHVAVATMADGSPLMAVSRLALHTANLERDRRASLLFVAPPGADDDTSARARITVAGRMKFAHDVEYSRGRLLRRHPDAFYIDFADFQLMRLEIERAHLVAGFGRIVDLDAAALTAPPALVDPLMRIDEGGCAHMNEDHLDALELIATELCGGPEGDWRAIGIDAQGIDLAADGRVVRAEYDTPVADGMALRTALKTLADRARASRGARASSAPPAADNAAVP